ncbi:hypothetical protein YC2023_108999 [Brassica napus]
MGCVSSNLLNQSDDFSQLAVCHHHLVQLTSSTYGLLNLDPPPPPSSSVISAPATPMTPPESVEELSSVNSTPIDSGELHKSRTHSISPGSRPNEEDDDSASLSVLRSLFMEEDFCFL